MYKSKGDKVNIDISTGILDKVEALVRGISIELCSIERRH